MRECRFWPNRKRECLLNAHFKRTNIVRRVSLGVVSREAKSLRRNPSPFAIVLSLLLLSIAVVHGDSNRARLGDRRSVVLPVEAVLDERSVPLLTGTGDIGFISSVTDGSVISFNPGSGSIVSSFVIGERAGAMSLVETTRRRLLAVPAANDPGKGRPATVMVLNATARGELEPLALIELPASAHITPASRAILSSDGRFGFIASSFDEPMLFCFSVETGQIASEYPLVGRPSEIVLHDATRMLAVLSATANTLAVLGFDEDGLLHQVSSFSPPDVRFEESNNAAFSDDGRTVFAAASEGDRLFAVDAASGALVSRVEVVGAPLRVTATRDLIAVTRVGERSGVTLVTYEEGRLAIKNEFTPPDQIEFSRANNVVFYPDAGVAFVSSKTGIVFAFSTETGELQSHQAIGPELLALALNQASRTLAVVRRGPRGDEVVVMKFDLEDSGEPGTDAPQIDALKPDRVEQARLKPLTLAVRGVNFTEDASLLVNGTQYDAELARGGKVLVARLPKELFDQVRELSVQVKNSAGASDPKTLAVVRPDAPEIDQLTPSEKPGPTARFTINVHGRNFRPTSIIVVDGQTLNTELVSSVKMRARVSGSIGRRTVQVKDAVVAGLASGEKVLTIFGPRIAELIPFADAIAGAGGFKLKIRGSNFREGASVLLDGQQVAAWRVNRLSRVTINVLIPSKFTQNGPRLEVVVQNPQGHRSDPSDLKLHAPSIETVKPSQLVAGTKDVAINLHGSFFRRRARVLLTNEAGQTFKVKATRVRFRSSSQVTVVITGQANEAISKPGTLDIQILNPNNGEGVPSQKKQLQVVAPEIDSASLEIVQGDESLKRLVILGKHFRHGVEIEFLKDGGLVRRQVPSERRSNRVITLIESKNVEALGLFSVRVVNPGKVKSGSFDIE